MLLTLLLQIQEAGQNAAQNTQTQVTATGTTQTTEMSVIDLILSGGWVMIPIALLLFLSIYLMIERMLYISKAAKMEHNLLNNLRDLIQQGNLKGAVQFCKNTPTATAAILEKGVSRIGKPMKDIESAMESVANHEVSKMEKNLSLLGIVAGIAPMLGFIGTISGIIKIFYTISLADNISIGLIAGGLYEKMITSGAGLIVGVIAYTGYHLLTMQIDRFTLKLEKTVIEFNDILQEPAK